MQGVLKMSKDYELEFLKSILKTEKEKQLIDWISQDLDINEILKKIKEKKQEVGKGKTG